MQHLSGKDFTIYVGDLMVQVESASLSIEDGRTTVKTGGVPNGFVDGEASASGEIELDSQNFALVMEAAKQAGSFKALAPFDCVFNAEAGENRLNIEAFGCLLKISDLLNADPKGGEKTKHKLPFDITSPDFIKINGVPYLDASEIENLAQQ